MAAARSLIRIAVNIAIDGVLAAVLVAVALWALRQQRREFQERNQAASNLYEALKVIVAEDSPEPERSKALWSIVRDFPVWHD